MSGEVSTEQALPARAGSVAVSGAVLVRCQILVLLGSEHAAPVECGAPLFYFKLVGAIADAAPEVPDTATICAVLASSVRVVQTNQMIPALPFSLPLRDAGGPGLG